MMTRNEWTAPAGCESGACVEVQWQTPIGCDSGSCVEVSTDGGRVLIRDGKNPAGPVLSFTPAEWARFVTAVYAGQFDTTPTDTDTDPGGAASGAAEVDARLILGLALDGADDGDADGADGAGRVGGELS